MKKILSLVAIFSVLLLTGCTNDANYKEANKIGKVLIKNDVISNNTEVIDKYVESYCSEACWDYTYYIHKDTIGSLTGINYQKLSSSRRKETGCDYLVNVNSNVTLNPNYDEYARKPYKGTNEELDNYNSKKDKYILKDTNNVQYCIKEYNLLFFKTYKLIK